MSRIPIDRFGMNITHQCNKNCENCCVDIKSSPIPDMTYGDFKYILSCFNKPESIKEVRMTGGEPFLHPLVDKFAKEIRDKFPRATIWFTTNGSLLDKHYWLTELNNVTFEVSQYPGWNDEIVKKYSQKKGIRIKHFRGGFINPLHSSGKVNAMKAYFECSKMLWLTGLKAYACCAGEFLERRHINEVGKVHFKMNPDWQNYLERLPGWAICPYCFIPTDEYKIGNAGNNSIFPQHVRVGHK